MPDVSQLLRQALPVGQRPVVSGYVSPNKPAPTVFTDPLWVILPSHSLDYAYGPCKWGALHGRTLPARGAQALVAFDDSNVPIVVWWDGPTTF